MPASTRLRTLLRGHEAEIATVAVVFAAIFAYLQLRKPAVVLTAAGSAPSGASGPEAAGYISSGASLAGSAFGEGAAAATSQIAPAFDFANQQGLAAYGFANQQGLAAYGLGGSALGLAGLTTSDIAGFATTLANSQAQLGSSLAGALAAQTQPAPTTSYPTSAPAPGTAPTGDATCLTRKATLQAALVRIQGYINTYLAIPASKRTAAQSAALATDQATLAYDRSQLAALAC